MTCACGDSLRELVEYLRRWPAADLGHPADWIEEWLEMRALPGASDASSAPSAGPD
jgi:hypothetical protein